MSLDIEAIKARAAAATPGPWSPCVNGSLALTTCGPSHDDTECGMESAMRDAEFIAHARTDVPALVAEVERLRAEVLAFRSDVERLSAFREQPAPAGDGPVVLADMFRHVDVGITVTRMIQERSEIGVARYGTKLRAYNGRDAQRDFREELLDAIAYGWQMHMEGRRMAPETREAFDVLCDVVERMDGGAW